MGHVFSERSTLLPQEGHQYVLHRLTITPRPAVPPRRTRRIPADKLCSLNVSDVRAREKLCANPNPISAETSAPQTHNTTKTQLKTVDFGIGRAMTGDTLQRFLLWRSKKRKPASTIPNCARTAKNRPPRRSSHHKAHCQQRSIPGPEKDLLPRRPVHAEPLPSGRRQMRAQEQCSESDAKKSHHCLMPRAQRVAKRNRCDRRAEPKNPPPSKQHAHAINRCQSRCSHPGHGRQLHESPRRINPIKEQH